MPTENVASVDVVHVQDHLLTACGHLVDDITDQVSVCEC